MPARNITVIPATINPLTRMPSGRTAMKRRVAGYARVSTDSDEQFTSYEAQVDYYTQYIKRNPEWEFVKVYTDEGISGTNTKHRDGFKEMIADALNGKIDLIVTKSVSRFARNTVDSLVTIRELKDKNVEVYFEKENIYTFDGKGELLITIMASLAQEESRSISENVTWGQRKRFADGKVSLPYKSFVGYKKGENDIPEVVPEEAELIRRIYSLFMSGRTSTYIAKLLTEEGIPAPRGGLKWQSSTIESILTNEKYKGCALLQKCFTVDFLTKKRKVNEGEVPQYFVENSHEAIISPEEWQAVQYEVARRKTIGKRYSGTSILQQRLYARTAVPSTVQRSGTQTVNTKRQSGAVMQSSMAKSTATRRPWMKKKLKPGSFRFLMAFWIRKKRLSKTSGSSRIHLPTVPKSTKRLRNCNRSLKLSRN